MGVRIAIFQAKFSADTKFAPKTEQTVFDKEHQKLLNANTFGDFVYAISGGDPRGNFRIDPLTGELFAASE